MSPFTRSAIVAAALLGGTAVTTMAPATAPAPAAEPVPTAPPARRVTRVRPTHPTTGPARGSEREQLKRREAAAEKRAHKKAKRAQAQKRGVRSDPHVLEYVGEQVRAPR